MSWQATTWASAVTCPSLQTKLVLLLLANHANQHGDDPRWTCYPSQQRLAEQAQCSRRSMVTYLAQLEEAGLLARESRGSPTGGRSSDLYILPVTLSAESSPPPKPGLSAESEGVVRKNGEGSVQLLAQGTVREQQEEPTPPGPPKGGKRRSRMTAGAQPTQQHRDDTDRLAPGLNLEAEWVRFRDYHLSHGSLRADWAASWREWLRRTDEYKRAHDPEYGWR